MSATTGIRPTYHRSPLIVDRIPSFDSDRRPNSDRSFPIKFSLFRPLCALLLASVLIPGALHAMALAYIDPLSGSVLLQVIAAGVLGAIFTTKSFLAKMRVAARAAWSKFSRK